jgi:hypothetical protein
MERVFIILLFFCRCITSFAEEHDAELVLHETSISIINGKLIKTIYNEIQINKRAGEIYTKITIPYSRLITVSKINACIMDADGVIIKKLQNSEITEKSAISDFSLYEDNYVKEFTMKYNTYPYRICYSYEQQEEEFLSIVEWLPVIGWKTPTRKAVLNLEVPKGFKISFRSQFTDSLKRDSSDILVRYTWFISYRNLIEPETFSPDANSLMPHVIIVPGDFKYDLPGSFISWVKLGEWENELNKNLSDLPQSEKDIILNQIEGVRDTKEKVRTLYHYLQDNTRYINIKIETGGLKPYPASYVAENKYGDCKALTNYFKSVLEVAGIKSYYTDVKGGDQIVEIDKSFPSQQFNHVFLCVPIHNDTLWLDCTSKMAFSYFGTFTQARDVFIIEDGRSHFTRTPPLSYNEVKETRKASFHQNLQNQTIADFSNTYRGEKYEYFFSLSNSLSETDRLQYLRNNVVKNGFELIDFNLTAPPRDSAKIFFTYTARSTQIYKVYGNDLLVEVLPFSIPRFEDPKKRKLPVQLDYPVYKSDSLEYEIPPDYKVPDKLTNESINSEFGSYKIESDIKGNKVNVVKSFLLFPGKYSLDKYPGFYQFLAKVIDVEYSNIIVTNKKF